MAGTLLQLAERGWEVHYFNLANGCCGSTTLGREECAAVRLDEARQAAAAIPATFHPPICNDLEIFYNRELLARVAGVVREARPSIVLTHSPSDYMEDHQNAARLAVTGTFSRGMPNFPTEPQQPIYSDEVAIYHAQPHGNRSPLGIPTMPSHFVDVAGQLDRKRELLSMHASQDQWLDDSQQISSYLQTMENLNAEVGRMSDRFGFAEGWRQHIHLGLSAPGFDPLNAELSQTIYKTI